MEANKSETDKPDHFKQNSKLNQTRSDQTKPDKIETDRTIIRKHYQTRRDRHSEYQIIQWLIQTLCQ
jgi:hypothetical protein